MGQLLVEKRPQPLQFGGIAKLRRADGLVEILGEDVIVDLFVEIGERSVRAARLAGRFGIVLALVGHVVVGNLRAVHLAVVHLLVGLLAVFGGRGVGAGIFVDLVLVLLVAAWLVFLGGAVLVVLLGLVVAVVLGHFHG